MQTLGRVSSFFAQHGFQLEQLLQGGIFLCGPRMREYIALFEKLWLLMPPSGGLSASFAYAKDALGHFLFYAVNDVVRSYAGEHAAVMPKAEELEEMTALEKWYAMLLQQKILLRTCFRLEAPESEEGSKGGWVLHFLLQDKSEPSLMVDAEKIWAGKDEFIKIQNPQETLLSGEMPANIEEAFSAAGAALFPRPSRDIETKCTCPDYANPCRHIAAVFYIIAEEFDRNPFLMFHERGCNRESLRAKLSKRSEGNAVGESESRVKEYDFDAAKFWRMGVAEKAARM